MWKPLIVFAPMLLWWLYKSEDLSQRYAAMEKAAVADAQVEECYRQNISRTGTLREVSKGCQRRGVIRLSPTQTQIIADYSPTARSEFYLELRDTSVIGVILNLCGLLVVLRVNALRSRWDRTASRN